MRGGVTLPVDLACWLAEVVRRHPGIAEVWLIGSRANGTETPESDWDFLVFPCCVVEPDGGLETGWLRSDQGRETGLPAGVAASIHADSTLRRADVDFLVVTDGPAVAGSGTGTGADSCEHGEQNMGSFYSAWGKPKRGSLREWKWARTSSHVAGYEEVKWLPDDEPDGEDGSERRPDSGSLVTRTRVAWRVWPR